MKVFLVFDDDVFGYYDTAVQLYQVRRLAPKKELLLLTTCLLLNMSSSVCCFAFLARDDRLCTWEEDDI